MRAQYPESEFGKAENWSQEMVLEVLDQAEREVSGGVMSEADDAHEDVVERAFEIWAGGEYVLAVVGADRVTARRMGHLVRQQQRMGEYNLVVVSISS